MAKLRDVRLPTVQSPLTRIQVSTRIGDLFRRVAGHQGISTSDLLEQALVLYIREHTSLELVFEDEPKTEPGEGIFAGQQVPLPSGVTEKRSGAKRRTAKPTDKLRAPAGKDRRKKASRRKVDKA